MTFLLLPPTSNLFPTETPQNRNSLRAPFPNSQMSKFCPFTTAFPKKAGNSRHYLPTNRNRPQKRVTHYKAHVKRKSKNKKSKVEQRAGAVAHALSPALYSTQSASQSVLAITKCRQSSNFWINGPWYVGSAWESQPLAMRPLFFQQRDYKASRTRIRI